MNRIINNKRVSILLNLKLVKSTKNKEIILCLDILGNLLPRVIFIRKKVRIPTARMVNTASALIKGASILSFYGSPTRFLAGAPFNT